MSEEADSKTAEQIQRNNFELHKQKKEFRKIISQLETQQFTSNFHAVAFKLEAELFKIIRPIKKLVLKSMVRRWLTWKRVCTAEAFKTQLRATNIVHNLKHCKQVFGTLLPKHYLNITARAFCKWKKGNPKTAPVHPDLQRKKDVYDQKLMKEKQLLDKLEKRVNRLIEENEQLIEEHPNNIKSHNLEVLKTENRDLREKLSHAEQNVQSFIREMGSLLAQHEPPSGVKKAMEEVLFASANKAAAKNFKMPRANKRASRKQGTSPDDYRTSTSKKRSVERKARLQFD